MDRKLNFIHATGSRDFLKPEHGDRRFMVVEAVDVGADRLRCLGPSCLSVSAVDNMKRKAKGIRKADGIKHADALEQVAKANGYASWQAVTVAATRAGLGRLTPPIGTPTGLLRPGNSTPARAPVTVSNQSPDISPVSGK